MHNQPFVSKQGNRVHLGSIIAIALTAFATAAFHVYGIVQGPAQTQPVQATASEYECTLPVEEKAMLNDIYGRFLNSENGCTLTDQYYQIGLWDNWTRALTAVHFHSAKPSSVRLMESRTTEGTYRIGTTYTGDMEEFRHKEAEYDAEVSRLVQTVDGKTIEEKVRFFHDVLINRCEYDLTLSKSRAYDCLIGGLSVCNGYASAFYNLCSAAGLEVNYIVGTVSVQGTPIPHAWNRVKGSDGQWHYYDVTGDDTSRSERFYDMTDQEMTGMYFTEEIV